MNKKEAGRFGGITTQLRAGSEGMSERGKLGGRPRLLTLAEVKGQTLALDVQKENKGGNRLPTRLKELKELWQKNKGGA